MSEVHDLAEGRRRRDVAIEQVAKGRADWLAEGHLAGVELAKRRAEFCSFDIWALLDSWGVAPPPEPRVMGALLARLRADHVIEPTERFLPSPRPQQHSQPCRVWRSLFSLAQSSFSF